jgi:hypothetical protein
MRKDKTMSLEEHLENANDLAIATHYLSKVFFRCQKHYPKSGRLMTLLDKMLSNTPDGVFTKINSELDDEYHKLITDKEFDQYGHIYYNLDERYKKLKSDFESK